MAKKSPAIPHDVVAQLLASLVDGKCAHTSRAYQGDLKHFTEHIKAPSAVDAVIRLLTGSRAQARTMLQQYRDYTATTLKVSTARRRVGTLLTVVRLASDRALIGWTAADVVPSAAKPKRSGNQVHLFVARLADVADHDQAPTRRAKALRDLAIVRLLHDFGLHPSTVAALDLADLSLAKPTPTLRVPRDHEGPQDLRLPTGTERAMRAWLQTRGIEKGPLFPSLDRARKGSGRMSEASVAQALAAAGDRLGVEITPGAVRASAIEVALRATGGDYKSVAAHFGIADPRTLAQHDSREVHPSDELATMIASDLP